MQEIMEADAEPTPEIDTRSIVKSCYEKLSSARSYRRQFDKDWSRYYLLYSGAQWDGRQEDWQSTPVVNLTKSFVDTVVPILTDGRPQFIAEPRLPDAEHISEVVSHILDWLWEARSCATKLSKTMINCCIFGSSFMKVRWNPMLMDGEGDIDIVTVDPVNIFASPFARSIEEAEYVIHVENMPRRMVLRMYRGLVDETMLGIGATEPTLTVTRNVTNQNAPGAHDNSTIFVRSTDGSSTYGYSRGHELDGTDRESDDLVTVLEVWERNDEGVLMQTVVVNDQFLFSLPAEPQVVPIVQFTYSPHTWTMWAMGAVQHVDKLQIEINRRRGNMADILRYCAQPMLLVDPSLVDDFESLKSRPGLVIPVEGGPQGAGWLQPAQLPEALFRLNEVDKADFDTVLGNVDVIQGRRPEGIEAGVAIELLQEAANSRIRLIVRYMEDSIQQLGNISALYIQHYYDTERTFRMVGHELAKMEKPLNEDGIRFFTINKAMQAQVDPLTGQPVIDKMNEIPKVSEMTFDIRVGAGSTLPVSRAAQFNKLVQLYQLGVVDDEELLKGSGLERWEDIYKRVQVKKLMAAQQAQQMQAMQAAQGSPTAAPTEPSDEMVDDELAGVDNFEDYEELE